MAEIHQPDTKHTEDAVQIAMKFNEFVSKFPKIQNINMIACDNESPELKHIMEQRKIYKLLLMFLDLAHCFNLSFKLGLDEVFGNVELKFSTMKIIKSYVPAMIKQTAKLVDKNPQILKTVLKYYKPGEYQMGHGASDTRFAGNIEAAEKLITVRIIKKQENLKEYDSTDSDEDLDSSENELKCHDQEEKDIELIDDNCNHNHSNNNNNSNDNKENELEHEDLSLLDALPYLTSTAENDTDPQGEMKKSQIQYLKPIDNELYDSNIHLDKYKNKNLKFDLRRIYLMAEVMNLNNDFKKEHKDIYNFWTKRPNVASLFIVYGIGKKCIFRIIIINNIKSE